VAARAIWTGSISFGLVNIPVRLQSATESKDVHFHQVIKGSNERIRVQRVGEKSGKPVDFKDIVKGYELDDGGYVLVEPEELEEIEPRRSRTIDIETFVELDDIDPIHFEKTYYVVPSGEGAEKAYALLSRALEDTGRVGIARFVMRSKEYLATIRAVDGLLLMETMYFPDEVRDRPDVSGGRVGQKELGVATQLIDAMTGDWKPGEYHDTYRQRVLDLIKAKSKGEEIEIERPEEPAPVTDLMEALAASLEGRKSGGGSHGRGPAKGRHARGKPGRSAKSGDKELSKAELEAEAKRLDIPGRSSMTKDELAEAVAAAS
jgi:DNA end-binding protein Ku